MTGRPETSPTPARGGPHDALQPDAVEVVRSEETLQVGSEVRVAGRAVLRRYVVTETVTQTFQVRHEEVRLDYEPVAEADLPAVDGGAFDDRVVEMVLRREVPVVQMKLEATEIVRLHVDTVTQQVQVSDEVRKERLLLDRSAEQAARLDRPPS